MMNRKLTFASFILLFVSGVLQSQQISTLCENPTAYTTIHANNVKAGLLNAGDLFWDFNDAQFLPNPTPAGPNPATIFAAGLWLSGLDPSGNLKLAAATYRSAGSTDYWAGPLNSEGFTYELTCSKWDRFFMIRDIEVKTFLEKLPIWVSDPNAAVAQHPSIMGWPATGNPFFFDVWGFNLPITSEDLAPFHDLNNDGQYNPLKGDYPVVKLASGAEFVPAEFVWCVFNDEGGGAEHANTKGDHLHVEVHQMVWAFNCAHIPVLNRTIFTSHKIFNKSQVVLDSCFAGIWVDFDLGCPFDDYIGSAPDLDAFFVYNQDAVDGTTGALCGQPFPTFADTSPVQSVVFLSQSMDKFMYYNDNGWNIPDPATETPDEPSEFYNYLTGSWRDGTSLTFSDNGYGGSVPAHHAFSGDPANPNEWSMCTTNPPYTDRKVIGSCKMELQPGQFSELVTAWTVHPNPNLPCDLGQTYDEIAFLHNEYDNNFSSACSGLTATQELPDAQINIFPNPATESITLSYGDLPVHAVRLIAADGKTMQFFQNIQPEQTVLNVKGLDSGIYYLQIQSEQGSATKLLVILL